AVSMFFALGILAGACGSGTPAIAVEPEEKPLEKSKVAEPTKSESLVRELKYIRAADAETMLKIAFGGELGWHLHYPTNSMGRVRTEKRQLFLPFAVDPKRSVAEVRLFAQRDGGAWEHLTTADPAKKGFNFACNQDGEYGLAVQSIFNDGTQ